MKHIGLTFDVRNNQTPRPDWVTISLDELRVRRAALIGIIEESLPEFKDEDARPVSPKFATARTSEINAARKIELWDFTWSFEKPAFAPDGAPHKSVGAFVVTSASAVARLNITAPAPRYSDLGGDDLMTFLVSVGLATDQQVGAFFGRLISECDRGADRVGFHLPWSRSAGSTERLKLAFEIKVKTDLAEQTPTYLRQEQGAEGRRSFVEALIAGSLDVLAVRGDAKRDYAKREAENPRRTLFDADMTEEGGSFCERAKKDLVGFSPPMVGEPTLIRTRRLQFYRSTDLIDMVDRRGGYPRISRFLAEYDTDARDGSRYTRVIPIDWIAKTIHSKNKNEGLALTSGNVRDYLDSFASISEEVRKTIFALCRHPRFSRGSACGGTRRCRHPTYRSHQAMDAGSGRGAQS